MTCLEDSYSRVGSLLYFPENNKGSMAKKVPTHKRHVGGLEAPRNSLELPVETSYGLCDMRDNILYAYHMKKESSDKNRNSSEAPMKKLICQENYERPNMKKNSPSIVARLMGVDTLPFDSKSDPQLVAIKTKTPAGNLLDKEPSEKVSVHHVRSASNPLQQLDFGSYHHYLEDYSRTSVGWAKSSKPKAREHPQEEELQKFKKEFEAWQAERFKECSKVVESSTDRTQLIAQADLNKEKLFLYSKKRSMISDELKELKDIALLTDPHNTPTSHKCKMKSKCHSAEIKESLSSNRMSQKDFSASQLMNSDSSLDKVLASAKIVILRPGPDRMDLHEHSWNCTPGTSEERGSIEDFLEEVRERLTTELQGKSSKRSTTVRGGGIETPYWEKPSEPRQIAQCLAQQARDNAIRNARLNFPRSESTRSYRSEIELNGTGSPEFIDRDKRKILAERLTNVLKAEPKCEISLAVHNKYTPSMLGNYTGDGRQSRHLCNNRASFTRSFTCELEKQSKSFRGELYDSGVQNVELSPRNLIRSLSAPVSGTSFGKLLLEDRHILTGAQIRRKQEVNGKLSTSTKKTKRDKFNLREKVSRFRYSFMLRGRLFCRKEKLAEKPPRNEERFLKDMTDEPTLMMSFCETHENSTEVPPSPASVCSSSHEEFGKPTDYSSTTASSGVLQLETDVPNVLRELNSNLNELRRKLNQLEGCFSEENITEQQPSEVEQYIEDQTEAYIRDLLVASGLYDGSYNHSLSKWDPLGKPISYHVFKEVEDSYYRTAKNNEMCSKEYGQKVNRKMILDLLNEILPAILKQPVNMSRYMRKVIVSAPEAPHGRKLLSCLLEVIRLHVQPPTDRPYQTLDDMLVRDLKSHPWSSLLDEDINVISRDIELQITKDLINEMVQDIQ